MTILVGADIQLTKEMIDRLFAGYSAAAEIAEFMNRPGDWNGGDVCDFAFETLTGAGFKISGSDEPTELPIEAETDGLYVATDTVCDEYDNALHAMCHDVNVWLEKHGFEALTIEQRQCLLDPERVEEAEDMVDDLQARVGVPQEVVQPILDVLPIRPIRAKAKAPEAFKFTPKTAAHRALIENGRTLPRTERYSLNSAKAQARRIATRDKVDMAVGWMQSDVTGNYEYGYCPWRAVGPAFVIEPLFIIHADGKEQAVEVVLS